MDYKEQHFDDASHESIPFRDEKKPYDLSKIEPMPPVPEDDISEAKHEFGQLETGLEGLVAIPVNLGTSPYDVTANPASGIYLGGLEEDKNKRKLKE